MKKHVDDLITSEENAAEVSAENIIHIPAISEISSSTQAKNERRFASIETLVYAVLFVALVSLVGTVVAVTTLVIDQMHFNNETYREQSTNFQTQVQILQQEINSLNLKKNP